MGLGVASAFVCTHSAWQSLLVQQWQQLQEAQGEVDMEDGKILLVLLEMIFLLSRRRRMRMMRKATTGLHNTT